MHKGSRIMFMDYYGIVNLVLVSVIYSTFISPNLTQLGNIRENIVNLDFPVIRPDMKTEDTKKMVDELGLELKKELARYGTKYNEVSRFLKNFYLILIGVFAFQLTNTFWIGTYTRKDLPALILIVFVSVLLYRTVRMHMVKPWKVRSIDWLTKGGVAPVHYRNIYNPRLCINFTSYNAKPEAKNTIVSIVSDIEFIGYSYILTIESANASRLFYVAAGPIAKHAGTYPVVYVKSGKEEYCLTIGAMDLKPAKYKVRLLILESPYGGINLGVSEVIMELEVGSETNSTPSEPIVLGDKKTPYTFEGKKGLKIKKVNFEESGSTKHIKTILSSMRFGRLLQKSRRVFTYSSRDGAIDSYSIFRASRKRRIYAAHVSRRLKSKKNRKPYLDLKLD